MKLFRWQSPFTHKSDVTKDVTSMDFHIMVVMTIHLPDEVLCTGGFFIVKLYDTPKMTGILGVSG